MKNLNKIIQKIIATTALLLGLCIPAFAQIPVTDGASIAKNIANHIENINQWTNQYKQMAQQYQQLQTSYQAITGTRNLGQLLNNPSLYKQLPDDWKSVYNNAKGAYGNIKGVSSKTTGQQTYYGTLSTNIGQLEQTYSAATQRLENLQRMMGNINLAQDAKAAQDLQNRFQAEQALLQNESIKLQLMAQLQQAQIKVAEEQKSHEFKTNLFKSKAN